MWASHAKLLERQPLLNYIDSPDLAIDDTTMFAEGVLNLVRGKQEIKESPLKEISPTLVNLTGWVEDKIERGSTPHPNSDNDSASGTALNLRREWGSKVYNPQARILNAFYSKVLKLTEEQILAGGVGGKRITKVNVKAEKDRKYYAAKVTPVDIKRDHIVRVNFTVKTPWTEMDVAGQADMLVRLGLPRIWVWENILKIRDPKLIQDLEALEIYEHSPQGLQKRAVEVLRDRGYVFEAEKLIEQMDRQEEQEAINARMGQPPPVASGEGSTPTGAIPLST